MAEEGFTDHVSADFVLLHHSPGLHGHEADPVCCPAGAPVEQLFEIGAGNIGHGTPSEVQCTGQTGANADLADA